MLRQRLDAAAGLAAGALLAPLAALGAALRHERLFHSQGVCYRARVLAATTERPYADVARRLAGAALVRFSAALWHDERFPDILGLALRLQTNLGAVPAAGDQDLLFATVRRPATLAGALLTTRRHDFLANDYYGVSPFEVEGLGRARLRVVAHGGNGAAGDRFGRLAASAAQGVVGLRLEIKPTGSGRWHPVVLIELREPLPLDQGALRFDPFRAGRGVRPAGVIHELRRPVYALAQRARSVASARPARRSARP